MLKETFDALVGISEKYSNPILQEETPNDTHIWSNYKFNTDKIRYGHIEYFKSLNEKVEVVHAMCYPSCDIPFPIFGFDAIALNGNVTGIFCDVTATPFDNREIRVLSEILFEKYNNLNRALPEWANFFSPTFLALSPGEKLDDILSDCLNSFNMFLFFICKNTETLDITNTNLHKEKQNEYSLHQQQNTKTLKALTSYIGEEKAKDFIQNVLFPVIN